MFRVSVTTKYRFDTSHHLMNKDQTTPGGMDHSKIIAGAAKETLAPLSIFQRGHSRTWIDDRGWWIVVIEFQPSGFSKGSYLNVGAMWLWHEKDHFTFDFGNDAGCRIGSFVGYLDEKQFTAEATKLASLAKAETLRLRSKFVSIHDAARSLPAKARRDDSPWTELSAAIALGYVGKTLRARRLFKSIERKRPIHKWEYELRERALGFAETLERPNDFQRYVKEAISRTRKLLKLPEITELGSIDQEHHPSRPLKSRFAAFRTIFQ
jgi:hypothetical protein